jgi:hypothetical protein
MTRRRLWWAWGLLSLAWLAGNAYACAVSWPSMPLDISPNDPATRAVFSRAIAIHVLRYTTAGLLPPLLVLTLGWLGARLTRGRA